MHTLHKYNIPHIPIKQGYKIPSPKNELENYVHAICILFTPWRTYTNIKKSINALWMQNLNVVYLEISYFNKCVIKDIGILHECKESKDVHRMMKQNENEYQDEKEYIDNFINPFYNKSVTNYDDDIEIHIKKTNDDNVN